MYPDHTPLWLHRRRCRRLVLQRCHRNLRRRKPIPIERLKRLLPRS